MKKLLYLTTSYLPEVNSGSIRAFELTNRLQSKNISSFIITKVPKIMPIVKKNLKNESQKKYQFIHRIELPFFSLIEKIIGFFKVMDMFIPDYYIFHYLFYWIYIYYYAKKKQIDCIYVEGAPFSPFLLGYILKILLHKPLILAYGDPWSDNPYHRFVYNHKKSIVNKLEPFLIQNADSIVFVSNQLKTEVLHKYHLEKCRFKSFVIPAGIDIPKKETFIQQKSAKELKLLSTCSFYLIRSPISFLELINEIKSMGILDSVKFHYNIYGFSAHDIRSKIKELGIERYVTYHGIINHKQAQLLQESSTLNVDINEKVIEYPSFPHHLWEYIASGNKILLLGKHNGYKVKYIEDNQLGYTLPLDQPEIMKQKFIELIERFQAGKLETKLILNENYIKNNSWDKRVNDLVKIIGKLTK